MNRSILDFFPALKPKGLHEYAGPCPLCGGAMKDGFIVWPDRPHGGAFMCRKCGASGDGIAFLMKRDGLTYREACVALGIEPRSLPSARPSRTRRECPARVSHVLPAPRPTPQEAVLPCREWMSAAAAFLADCQRGLEENPDAVVALAWRHLTPHTARACGLGWNFADRYVLRKSWGLAAYQGSDGRLHDKLLVPRGLIIATRRGDKVAGLAVRCLEEDRQTKGRPKYWQVPGSADVPLVVGHAGHPVLLVESALDACLAWQESGGQVAGVGFMGSTKPADAATDAFIRSAPQLLAAPDSDEAGRAAWQRWRAAYPHAILAPAVGFKDLGEQHAAALSWPLDYGVPTVGEWLKMALADLQSVETAKHGQCSAENF